MSIELHNFRIDNSILQRILDFLPYPFLISEFRDGVRKNIFVNQKFVEEIGYTVDDIPTIDDWFERAYPDVSYRQEIVKGWGKRHQTARSKYDNSVSMKAIIHTKSSGDVWYEVKSSFFGRVSLVAFVNIHEITIKEQELERLNENKNRTLSILSHDLRSPITNLHSLSQLALNRHLTQQEFVTMVRNVNEKTFQVLEFLDTTLLWTRSNFDNINLRIEQVNLDSIIRSILSVYESSYQAKRIMIRQQLEHTTLNSDPEIITIVIRNLISNAIKFTAENGSIEITAKRKESGYLIHVKDSGIGMNHEVIERILTDNYTSRNGTQQEKGLGIGLKLCRELLKKINGQLEIKSMPGQGTLMSIVLPDETVPE
ncbi:MAG TPA: HAMP domain-containing sensor histidine kinase [Ohtaekwangia sp.]